MFSECKHLIVNLVLTTSVFGVGISFLIIACEAETRRKESDARNKGPILVLISNIRNKNKTEIL